MEEEFDPSLALQRIRQASELPLSQPDLPSDQPYAPPQGYEAQLYSNPSHTSYPDPNLQYKGNERGSYSHLPYSLPLSTSHSQPKIPPHSSSASNLNYDLTSGFLNNNDTVKPSS